MQAERGALRELPEEVEEGDGDDNSDGEHVVLVLSGVRQL